MSPKFTGQRGQRRSTARARGERRSGRGRQERLGERRIQLRPRSSEPFGRLFRRDGRFISLDGQPAKDASSRPHHGSPEGPGRVTIRTSPPAPQRQIDSTRRSDPR
jgi:hypothetical protein